MHGVFTALINGIEEKGEGGVAWVRGDRVAYCFPEDFNNEEFANGLRMLLDNPHANTLFYVVNEKEGKAHVVAYPRVNVYKDYHEELAKQKKEGAEEGRIEEEGVDMEGK